jgi:hypothetical protein
MARRFPPPWRADNIPGGYVVRDANGRLLKLIPPVIYMSLLEAYATSYRPFSLVDPQPFVVGRQLPIDGAGSPRSASVRPLVCFAVW